MDSEPEPISFLLLNTDWIIITKLIILILLLLCSALISGAEIAFFSISQTEIDELKEKTKGESTIVKLLDRPKRLLGTILITNNFINILIVLLFASVGEFLLKDVSKELRFFVEVILVTFLILLFGEVLPKVYANRKALVFANLMAKPVNFLSRLMAPLSVPLIRVTGSIENKLGNKNNNLSVEKLSQALELTSNNSTSKEEQKILEGIVTFGNTETIQIMKPRTDVCAISEDTSYEEVLKIILKNGYSRNPVYQDNIDNIIGVLYAKDLLVHLDKINFKWQSLVRKPFFVPENKKLDDLLKEFQEKKNHLAIVVDEYGGTSGIVTLEDVIEEIFGEIRDETDREIDEIKENGDYSYVAESGVLMEDMLSKFDLELKDVGLDSEFSGETISYVLTHKLERFPNSGEIVSFEIVKYKDSDSDRKLDLKVGSVKDGKIGRVEFTLL